jgi:hypothetical protein
METAGSYKIYPCVICMVSYPEDWILHQHFENLKFHKRYFLLWRWLFSFCIIITDACFIAIAIFSSLHWCPYWSKLEAAGKFFSVGLIVSSCGMNFAAACYSLELWIWRILFFHGNLHISASGCLHRSWESALCVCAIWGNLNCSRQTYCQFLVDAVLVCGEVPWTATILRDKIKNILCSCVTTQCGRTLFCHFVIGVNVYYF